MTANGVVRTAMARIDEVTLGPLTYERVPVSINEGDLDVILAMAHDGKAVHVSLLKDHDNPEVPDMKLALDPTTMPTPPPSAPSATM